MVRFIADPIDTIRQVIEIMSDPNYKPITGPVSIVPALESAKDIRINRRTEPIDGQLRTFNVRAGSGGSRGARGEEELDLTPERILEEITNNDAIVLTPEMVEDINDPEIRMTSNGEITKLTGRDVIRRSGQFSRASILPDLPMQPKTKKKRKVSKYQKEFGKQMKMLKVKHPRTPVTRLMKRAHSATRKAMK